MTGSIDPIVVARAPADANPAPAWRVGEVLEATVRRGPGGVVRLEIGAQRLIAEGAAGLADGRTVRLRVERLGPPALLRVIGSAARPAGEAERALAAALRRYLPLERAPGAALAGALRARASPRAQLARSASELIAATPTRADLTRPEGLRASLERAGTAWEARLRAALERGGTLERLATDDIKPLLERFVAALRAAAARPADGEPRRPETAPAPARSATPPAPGEPPPPPAGQRPPPRPGAPQPASPAGTPPPTSTELLALAGAAEGALARVWSNQLRAVRQREQGEPPGWRIDLPVRNGESCETLTLIFERQPRRRPRRAADASGGPAPWSVELRTTLGSLGALRARVGVAEQQVSVTFWAEREPTVRLLQARLEELAAGLRARGLSPAALHAARERRPPGDEAEEAGAGRPLIEVRA